jgi:hypothetical protein
MELVQPFPIIFLARDFDILRLQAAGGTGFFNSRPSFAMMSLTQDFLHPLPDRPEGLVPVHFVEVFMIVLFMDDQCQEL